MRPPSIVLLLAALALPAFGSGVSAQQVEYATRNVQPTHAVRFSSKPIRITLTERGVRQGSGIRAGHGDGRRTRGHGFIGRHRGWGGSCRGGTGSGAIVIRIGGKGSDSGACSDRPRTVYGAGHPRSKDRTARSERDEARSAERRRHLLRVQAILRSQDRARSSAAR